VLSGKPRLVGGGCWLDNGAIGDFTGCTFVGTGPTTARVVSPADCHRNPGHTILAFQEAGAPVWCDSGTSATLSCCDLYGNLFGDWVGCIADQHGCGATCGETRSSATGERRLLDPVRVSLRGRDTTHRLDLIGALEVGCGMTEVAEKPPLPETFALFANIPNPFNPVTEIPYAIPADPGRRVSNSRSTTPSGSA